MVKDKRIEAIARLHALAKHTRDRAAALTSERDELIVAAVDEGVSRADIARACDVTWQNVDQAYHRSKAGKTE